MGGFEDSGVQPLSYVALGSNLPSRRGDPAENLRQAVGCLAKLGRMTAVSSIYETEPVGDPGQALFLNAAAAIRTGLAPMDLLQRLLAIERDFGRERDPLRPKGPRTLDLDLLLVEDQVICRPRLTLPHPAMAERRFVLAPLAEIAPGLIHPVLHRSMADLLLALPDEGENRRAGVRKMRPLVF